MQSIFADLTVTALYVTHDRDEAFAIADTVAVMDRGRLLRKGTPEELWHDPQHEFVARMLGFDAIVNAKVDDGWAELGWTRVASNLDSGEHRLAVPPHAVVVTPAGTITGKVAKATYRAGSYDLDIAVGTTIIHAVSSDCYSVGDPVSFDLTAEDLMAIHT